MESKVIDPTYTWCLGPSCASKIPFVVHKSLWRVLRTYSSNATAVPAVNGFGVSFGLTAGKDGEQYANKPRDDDHGLWK